VQLCRGAAGTQIECLNGLLWITEEGEGRDVLVHVQVQRQHGGAVKGRRLYRQ